MKRNSILAALSIAATLSFSGNAHAYATFYGEDVNNMANTPLSSTPNSSAAEASFKSYLRAPETETFESKVAGTVAPLSLFSGVSATLAGGNGQVTTVTPGQTNGAGRYSIQSATSSNYWDVQAGGSGNFTITFSQAIAALGFYGIDIGDFVGQLTLGVNGTSRLVDNSAASTDGSVLYYGLIADVGEEFNSISFNTTTGTGDYFGFDNFTIATRDQICQPGSPDCGDVPEPTTLALFGLALAGLGLVRKMKA